MVKTDKPCYCLGFGNTVNYIIIWWPFTVWPKLGSASFGVRQWKVTKLWYNLQYTQNLDNNHGLSITYLMAWNVAVVWQTWQFAGGKKVQISDDRTHCLLAYDVWIVWWNSMTVCWREVLHFSMTHIDCSVKCFNFLMVWQTMTG